MDITRKQMTNVEKWDGKGISAPMNAFGHFRAFPPLDFKTVVRPNFDTMYSSLWLDLTTEPMIISLPDSKGRYYLLPALDMWTDVFAVPGWRTTGTKAGNQGAGLCAFHPSSPSRDPDDRYRRNSCHLPRVLPIGLRRLALFVALAF